MKTKKAKLNIYSGIFPVDPPNFSMQGNVQGAIPKNKFKVKEYKDKQKYIFLFLNKTCIGKENSFISLYRKLTPILREDSNKQKDKKKENHY